MAVHPQFLDCQILGMQTSCVTFKSWKIGHTVSDLSLVTHPRSMFVAARGAASRLQVWPASKDSWDMLSDAHRHAQDIILCMLLS